MELTNTYLTKGTGFNVEEREKYKLAGLLPPNVETLEVRVIGGVCFVCAKSTTDDEVKICPMSEQYQCPSQKSAICCSVTTAERRRDLRAAGTSCTRHLPRSFLQEDAQQVRLHGEPSFPERQVIL